MRRSFNTQTEKRPKNTCEEGSGGPRVGRGGQPDRTSCSRENGSGACRERSLQVMAKNLDEMVKGGGAKDDAYVKYEDASLRPPTCSLRR